MVTEHADTGVWQGSSESMLNYQTLHASLKGNEIISVSAGMMLLNY